MKYKFQISLISLGLLTVFNTVNADTTVTSSNIGWMLAGNNVNNVPQLCHLDTSGLGGQWYELVNNTSSIIMSLTHENSEADCLRGFASFDLNGINTSTITGAYLIVDGGDALGNTPANINSNWGATDSGDGNWAVFGFTPSSTVNVQATDFSSSTHGNVSSTFYSTASTTASWPTNLNNNRIDLNSDAINHIKTSGSSTAFVFRGSYDYNNAGDNPVNHTNFIMGHNFRLYLIQSGGGGGGASSVTVDLSYPSSSAQINSYYNFDKWVASTTGEFATSSDFIGVNYSKYLLDLTNRKLNEDNIFTCLCTNVLVGTTWVDIKSRFDKHETINDGNGVYEIGIPSIDNLVGNASQTTWYAYAFIASPSGTITALGGTKTFMVATGTGIYPTNSTTTNLAKPIGQLPYQVGWQPTISTYQVDQCTATSSFFGLTIGQFNLYCLFFAPDPKFQQGLEASWNNLQNQFPFSVFAEVRDTANTALNNVTNSQASLDWNLPHFNGVGTTTIPVLTTGGLSNAFGTTNLKSFMDIISDTEWIGALAIIIKTIL